MSVCMKKEMTDEALKLLRLVLAATRPRPVAEGRPHEAAPYRVPTAWRDALPTLFALGYVTTATRGDAWDVRATDAGIAFCAGIDYVMDRM